MSPKQQPPTVDYWREWMSNVREGAVKAYETGRSFYVFRMEVQRQMAGWTNSDSRQSDVADVPGALQTFEEAGWTLFDTGYVFVPSREQSHMLTASANVAGSIVGIFTFRRKLDAPPPPPGT